MNPWRSRRWKLFNSSRYSVTADYLVVSPYGLIPINGLIAFWDFENMSSPGIVSDRVSGTILVAEAGGDFDIGSAFVQSPAAIGDGIVYGGRGKAFLATANSFSISFWINYYTQNGEVGGHRIAGNDEWDIRRMLDGSVAFYRKSVDGSIARVISDNKMLLVPSTNWHHIVATSAGEVMTIRVSKKADWYGVRGRTSGGSYSGIQGLFYAGPSPELVVDQIRIYNRAITEYEELALYLEAGTPSEYRVQSIWSTPISAVLVAHWNCETITNSSLRIPATYPSSALDLDVETGAGLFLAGLSAVGSESVDISDNIVSSSASALNLGEEFSISFWLYPISLAVSPTLILGKAGQYLVEYADKNVWFSRNVVHHDDVFDIVNGGPQYSMVSVKAPAETVLDAWNHIIVTSQEGKLTARVSVRGSSFGELAENIGNIQYEADGNSAFKVGSALLSAAIDEIRVYLGVLTTAEQQSLFNAF